ncbi:MAG: cytochrome b [Gallionella sp.]
MQHYIKSVKLVHWSMALLVITSITAVEFMDSFPKGTLRHEDMNWHYQAGLCVLILIFVRIALRLRHTPPPISPPLEKWASQVSALTHLSLYGLMLVLPIMGILTKQSKGDEVNFFGHLLPIILDEDRGLPYALTIKTVHMYLGDILIGLVMVHVAAALFHHVIRGDNTLNRMLPWGETHSSIN